jgi:hypothetical protein
VKALKIAFAASGRDTGGATGVSAPVQGQKKPENANKYHDLKPTGQAAGLACRPTHHSFYCLR